MENDKLHLMDIDIGLQLFLDLLYPTGPVTHLKQFTTSDNATPSCP